MRTDIETLKIFLAAAETLSFRRTATHRQVSPQVVTRAIQALEERLGELLFHRSTRGVRLSDFGAVFKERSSRAVEHMDGLFASSAASRPSKIAGLVRVAAPTLHGQRFVLPVLADLTRLHPGLHFDLRLSDEVVDPAKERIDVGVRGGRVSNSRLVVRTVAPVPNIICASPQLVAVLGSVNSIQQLETAPTTQLIDRSSGRPWPWELAGGREFVPRNVAFCTDDPIAEHMAVLEVSGSDNCLRPLPTCTSRLESWWSCFQRRSPSRGRSPSTGSAETQWWLGYR